MNYSQEDLYSRYSSETPFSYSSILSIIIRFARPGKILDIGCGFGFLGQLSRNWGIECYGLDGIFEGCKKASDNGVPTVHFTLAAEPFLPFQDNKFSAVVINQVICYTDKKITKKLFSESFRVLSSNGILYLSSLSKNWRRKIEGIFSLKLNASEIEGIIKEVGFKIIWSNFGFRFGLRINPLLRNIKVPLRLFDFLIDSCSFVALKQ